ncbi:hypothetical protein OGAPHI_000792 [Ogataea philodendri]|uniref:37S ribosomal protein MRP4, mitochondrial n=1 Tax=Ogataea philodendri TaxID=1378263 RepID=A0A9P8PFQ0_9ASCO|nr:uncharacterized protein OGAPHI_000792 [Ogataea philodendri]KAH3671081.1 hypothetical protein OGAPHI_000792 [Ogataea philodendri]
MSLYIRRFMASSAVRLNTAVKAAAVTESVATEEPVAAKTEPVSNVLDELKNLSKDEFEELLNSTPMPTLNRDDLAMRKFKRLFKAFVNRGEQESFSASKSMIADYPNLIPTGQAEPYSESELVVRQRYHDKILGGLGADVQAVYRPHELISRPPSANQITVQKLLAAGAHLGHYTQLWQHKTQPYIYGIYDDLHIIDLEQTLTHLRRAAKVVEGVVENGGTVLFLGLKEGQLRAVRAAAGRCNGMYVASKWVPGTITNSLRNAKPRIEVDMSDVPTGRDLTDFEERSTLKPDLVVTLSALDSKTALGEAAQSRIPSIGIVDTNCDPDLVTYAIPANDDSIRATNLICGVLAKAAERGYQRRMDLVLRYKKQHGADSTTPVSQIDFEAANMAN